MEKLKRTVDQLTVKQLQKFITKSGADLRGKYKEEKSFYVEKIIEMLNVSLSRARIEL